MVKVIFLFLSLVIGLMGNSFENDCLKCHKQSGVPLDMIYKRYLLEFSSHSDIKRAMVDFLKHPAEQKSALPKGMLMNMGVKKKSTLSDLELNMRVDEYLKMYDIKKRIIPAKPSSF